MLKSIITALIGGIFAVTANASITIEVDAAPPEFGSVIGGGEFESGESFSISATSLDPIGHPFRYWLSDRGRSSSQKDASFKALATINGFPVTNEIFIAYFGDDPTNVVEEVAGTNPVCNVEIRVAPECEGLGTVSGGGSFDYNDQCTLRATALHSTTNRFLFFARVENFDSHEEGHMPICSSQIFDNPYTHRVKNHEKWYAYFGEKICRIEIVAVPCNENFYWYPDPLGGADYVASVFNRMAPCYWSTDGRGVKYRCWRKVAFVPAGTVRDITSHHVVRDPDRPISFYAYGLYRVLRAVNVINNMSLRPVDRDADIDFNYYTWPKLRSERVYESETWVVYYVRWDNDIIIRSLDGTIWRNPAGFIEHIHQD